VTLLSIKLSVFSGIRTANREHNVQLSVSDLPAGFNEMVWSKVRTRETPTRGRRENWLTTLLSALATPQWAAAGLALVLLAGWTLGRITAGLVASPTETRLAASVTVIENTQLLSEEAESPDPRKDSKTQLSHSLQEQLASAINPGFDSFQRDAK
jgi:hypothetical protein